VATAPPPRVKSKSEADYLAEQAANAKAAFKQTLEEIKSGLGTGISPAEWTKEHPWTMLASAMVLGFTATTITVPSKQQAALRRLKKVEAALKEPPPERIHESNGHKTEKRGLTTVIVAELIRAATGIVSTLLKSATAPPPSPIPPTDTNQTPPV
jgi:hypothetical protein